MIRKTRMKRRPRRGDNPALRHQFAEEHLSCAACWRTWRELDVILEVHHILGGRWGRKDHPSNLLSLCRDCHRILQGGRREEGICLRLKSQTGEYDRAALVDLHKHNRERVPPMARRLPWWVEQRRQARRSGCTS